MRAHLASLSLLLAAAPAHGDSAATYEIVHASVTASAWARGAGPGNVLDQDVSSAWCVDANTPGATLTIELAHPVPVERVTVGLGVVDAREDAIDRPGAVLISLDDGPYQTVRGESPYSESLALDDVSRPVRRVSFRFADSTGKRCISEISLERGRQAHSLLQFIDGDRLGSLVSTLGRLRDVVGSCDPEGLQKMAVLPLPYEAHDRYAAPRERWVKRTIEHVGELVSSCRPRAFIDTSVREIDGDTVAVFAGGDWVLHWQRPGGWQLVELPDDYGAR